MTRLTDERIAEIETLWSNDRQTAMDAIPDLLTEVKALKAEKESMAEEYNQRLSHEIDDYYNAWANHQVEMEQLKKQLTQAEAERDVLADILSRAGIFTDKDEDTWTKQYWLKYAQKHAEKKQSHLEFLRAELATVNDILATIAEGDVVGRMSFEGRKQRIEAELQQAEKQGEQE